MSIFVALTLIALWVGTAQQLCWPVRLAAGRVYPAYLVWLVGTLRLFCVPSWIDQLQWLLPYSLPARDAVHARQNGTQPYFFTSALPHHAYALSCSLLT